MIWGLVSLLSSSIGTFLFDRICMRRLDSFSCVLGHALYTISKFRQDDVAHMRACQRAAVNVTIQVLIVIASIAAVIAIASIPFLLLPFPELSTSTVVWMIAGAVPPIVVYFKFLRPSVKAYDYPPSKQLAYYATLGCPQAWRGLSSIERAIYRPPSRPESAIIVTGLARAGTTALLRNLYTHPRLWSFTYRHMPFLMASRSWLKLNRRSEPPTERSHRDGIMVDLDSPEAFDEYFWRVVLQESYYSESGLSKHKVSGEQIASWEKLVSQHLTDEDIYLSKNNNFLLRLESFLEARPDYRVVIVFRQPLAHAKSLLRQQRLQTEEQERDPFIIDYMDMLGHNEFGKHRLDFLFDDTGYLYEDPQDLNYWVERWIKYYEVALGFSPEQVVFVPNDEISANPTNVVNQVLKPFDLSLTTPIAAREFSSSRDESSSPDVCHQLLSQADELYKHLTNVQLGVGSRLSQERLV